MIETARTLDSALKFVGAKARERRQKLTITVEPEAEILYADERALKQIVINLVSNSIKFTRDGGNIDVVARRNGSGDFELMVEDNGQGFPKDKLDQISALLARGQPLRQRPQRHGIGACAGTRLAELHGGRAWMESEEAIGYARIRAVTDDDRGAGAPKRRLSA
jgi:two-component system cell cycle sensor histidine kinase PleC